VEPASVLTQHKSTPVDPAEWTAPLHGHICEHIPQPKHVTSEQSGYHVMRFMGLLWQLQYVYQNMLPLTEVFIFQRQKDFSFTGVEGGREGGSGGRGWTEEMEGGGGGRG